MYKVNVIDSEEYKVYSDMLCQRLNLSDGTGPLIIKNYTTTGLSPISDDLAEAFKKMFGIDGIQEKNQRPCKLGNQFEIDAEVILISEEDINKFSLSDSGLLDWDAFRAKYKSSIMELSRVSFDKNRNRAYLYYGFQADYHMGYGCHLILKRGVDMWTIEHELPAWKS